jgi:hypothetical protein
MRGDDRVSPATREAVSEMSDGLFVGTEIRQRSQADDRLVSCDRQPWKTPQGTRRAPLVSADNVAGEKLVMVVSLSISQPIALAYRAQEM